MRFALEIRTPAAGTKAGDGEKGNAGNAKVEVKAVISRNKTKIDRMNVKFDTITKI